MRPTLILAKMQRLITVVTAVMIMPKKAQTREVMMKRKLTPLDLKTFCKMIVMMI